MARRMETGIIWINKWYNFVPGVSGGGYKQSGFGREGGLVAMEEYTHTKTVILNLAQTAGADSFVVPALTAVNCCLRALDIRTIPGSLGRGRGGIGTPGPEPGKPKSGKGRVG